MKEKMWERNEERENNKKKIKKKALAIFIWPNKYMSIQRNSM